MPKFKKITLGGNGQSWPFQINVSAAGEFYTNLPDELKGLISDSGGMREFDGKCWADTFHTLEHELRAQIAKIVEPEVETFDVIRYWLQPSVSFCTDGTPESAIYRNGSELPDDRWQWCDTAKYNSRSCHWCNSPGMGFYLGAAAYTKTVTKLHKGDKVEYSRLSNGFINSTLNGWQCGTPPGNAKEMPYTEEAALFFDGAIRNTVELARRVVDFLADDATLTRAIEQGAGNLLGGLNDA